MGKAGLLSAGAHSVSLVPTENVSGAKTLERKVESRAGQRTSGQNGLAGCSLIHACLHSFICCFSHSKKYLHTSWCQTFFWIWGLSRETDRKTLALLELTLKQSRGRGHDLEKQVN